MEDPKPVRFTKNGFDKFDICRIEVVGDGNCWFHGLCMAFFIPYRTQRNNGVSVSRISIVKSLRTELSNKLREKTDPGDKNSPTIYDTLSRGQLSEWGSIDKEYSLEGMINHLDSDDYCGEEIQEFVSDELNKNIFYIDLRTEDVYITSDIDLLYKDRPSVVLFYTGNHYDTCAVRDMGNYISHFTFDHPFIQFLYNRLKSKKNN